MIEEEIIKKLYSAIFEKKLIYEMISFGRIITFEANDILIDLQEYITGIPLILNGALKITREDYEDGELLLYFLEKGDTCAMTLNCCLGNKPSKIRAIAESKGQLLMIPIEKMDEWIVKYPSWRSFVFRSYQNRLDEMLHAIDNLAFNDMTSRLKNYLIDVTNVKQSKTLNKTHQEIANELNTSRVVISRLLKILEKEDFLQMNRNTIKLK